MYIYVTLERTHGTDRQLMEQHGRAYFLDASRAEEQLKTQADAIAADVASHILQMAEHAKIDGR